MDGQLSDLAPAITSIGGFEPSSSFAAWSSEPSFISATFFPLSSDATAHSSTRSEPGSGDPALSVSDTEGARRGIGCERGKANDGKDPIQSGSITVPEPEALPLSLFGLAAVGIGARRRNVFPAAE
jgi:hypothetical protein